MRWLMRALVIVQICLACSCSLRKWVNYLFHVCIWPPFHFECFHALAVNHFRMHLPVDQAATASSESLALSICFTPDMHGILSGILWEPLCLGHAKAKTPRLRAKLSRRRTGWAAGSKLRRIAGCVASRGGWRLSRSQCSNDYHFSCLHLSSSAVAASSWYRSCNFESKISLKRHMTVRMHVRYHDTCFWYPDNMAEFNLIWSNVYECLSPLSPRPDGAAQCRVQRWQRLLPAAPEKSRVCWCHGRKWSET